MRPLYKKITRTIHTNMGEIEETCWYLFGCRGLKFWTEHHNHHEADQVETTPHCADLFEMEKYQEWRRKMRMMRLSDEEFDQVLQKF